MLFKDYKEKAMMTNGCGKRATYFLHALTGEIGELVDELKKVSYHNHEINKEKILKEVGDIMWAIAYYENIHEHQFEEMKIYDKIINNDEFKHLILDNGHYIYAVLNSKTTNYLIDVKDNDLKGKLDVVAIKLLSISGRITEEFNQVLFNNINQTSVDTEMINKVIVHNFASSTCCIVKRNLIHLLSILSYLCNSILESTIDDAMKLNIDKLQKRYNGSFSSEKSIDRVDVK
ncbi:MAG: MazG nucleotide pyrophosphohydrolase domain-containing protein [Cetobacterium sp.]